MFWGRVAACGALVVLTGCAQSVAQGTQGGSTVEATPEGGAPTRAAGPAGAVPRAGEVGRITSEVISSVPTKRKVVFLTIDDGWEQDPGFVRQVREQGIPITVFATRQAVEAEGTPDQSGGTAKFVGAGKWGYFRELRDAGVSIENHTLTHPNLRLLGPQAQRQELCGASKVIKKEIGVRPVLFRPPFGNYNQATLDAMRACGMKALLLWTATVQPGGKIAYQVPDKRLRPGDILLLHFRPNLDRDFRILVKKIKRRGFELGNLQAYLRAAGVK
ncbi:polysaccharide deacetylase family protein [Nonomuraea soli]|uniref:Peptidoglycan/xylan/chitin deacetylase (PgdA/CDA1 family) n=1 Tax=Nonomuraea soli TaxID=1032476 RepID=A0A7W0CNY9_9ACTN|nr:polysaccharide deacetylase family protein [Nonomuraea soli]MBA2894615.1 peptidoglycan/xylan/chitin deacetylase (PgdA/CDA1 family) [Nonomuraea soli]